MIRAVLVDLDNTLILEDEATFSSLRGASTLAGERAGVDAARLSESAAATASRLWRSAPIYPYADRMGIWWGEGLWGDFAGQPPELEPLRAFVPEFRERTWREALRALGVADDALARDLADRYRVLRRAEWHVDPNAEQILQDLSRDHALALVTNGAPDVQREKLAGTSLARYFGAIVISCEVGVAKPDPRIFHVALERIGAAATEAAMVGDSLARDIAGARAAGLRSVWLDRGLWKEDGPRPDVRIESLSEIRSALDALEPPAASRRGSRAPRPAKARDASRGRASRTEDR